MKRFFFPLALVFAIACSQKGADESAQTLDFTFDLDTVMVDSGDDLIYLRSGLHQSGLSSDGTTLYNFNDNENLLEVIDLDNLRLSHKTPFEVEGPHGTGRVYSFQYLTNGRFLLSNFTSIGIFSEQAQKEYSYDFSKLPAGIFDKGEMVLPEGILSEDGKSYVTFYAQSWARTNGIANLDLETGTIKRVPMDQLEAWDRYTIKVHDESQMEISMVGKYLSWNEGKVLISNSVDNELLIYDPKNDSLSQHTFHAKLTPNNPKEFDSREVDTREEFLEMSNRFQKDVFFGRWLYDPSIKRFYRLSYLFEREVDTQKEFKVILTILDNNFHQLYEGITPLKKKYFKPIVRGGKLYLYENINDELAFIVLTLNDN